MLNPIYITITATQDGKPIDSTVAKIYDEIWANKVYKDLCERAVSEQRREIRLMRK